MKQKRIVILGGGESGVGAAILAKKQNFDVFVSDFGEIKQNYKDILIKYKIDFEEKQHSENLILNADEIVKSPGIADKVEIIKKIKSKNINIISEIEFAGRYTNAKLICITGSNGKTTTTLLIYHILKESGFNVGLAGNVGESFAFQVAENNFDWFVIELSSFQLDGMYEFKADIAILLNITPDHLDRYNYEFQNYIDSKFRIIQNLTVKDSFIYCDDDTIIKHELEQKNITATKYPISVKTKIENGALIDTEDLYIFIGISLQQFELNGKKVLTISEQAPIYNTIKDKNIGDKITIGSTENTIVSIS